MTDMNSVNKIIGCENIDSILFFKNITLNHKTPTHHDNSIIDISSLSFCRSIHDLPIKYDSSHIKDFIAKYKRRYDRIVEMIKSNNESVIYFIRKSKITMDEKNTFINNIRK